MMRTTAVTLIVALAAMLSAGTALALNAIDCGGGGIRCAGTDRSDLMRGSNDLDAMYGRDGGDTLKGRREGDALLGHKGGDTLLGGPGQDFLIGGVGDDTLRGGEALDIYYFERPDWGRDNITEVSPFRNILRLPDGEGFGGRVTTNLESDSGPLPEVSLLDSGSTVDWRGEVIDIVIGSTGDDEITGTEAAEMIFDGEGRETDTDTILGEGGRDLIDVQDGAADDKVECGAGNDTVYFDQELELISPEECEEKNPVPHSIEGRRAAADRAKVLENAAASTFVVRP